MCVPGRVISVFFRSVYNMLHNPYNQQVYEQTAWNKRQKVTRRATATGSPCGLNCSLMLGRELFTPRDRYADGKRVLQGSHGARPARS